MKKLIESAEAEKNHQWGYLIRCDAKHRPSTIVADKYFHLWEFELLSEYLRVCELHKLDYDLVIQDFDNEEQSVDEINIINNNCYNQ
jgi:hypothetical protein